MAHEQLTKSQQGSSKSHGWPEAQASSVTKPNTHPVMQLQRTLGNRTVQRLIESARMTAQRESFGSYHDREDTDLAGGFEEQLAQRQGRGSPLPENARAFLESRLGIDLSPVRIHTDGQSHQLADAVNAKAFTTGTDIFFREGEYSPGSSEGMRLLAHEVTHVLQQSLGPVAGNPIEGSGVSVSDPSDSFEREADSVAEQVMARTPSIELGIDTTPSNAGDLKVFSAVQRQDDEYEIPEWRDNALRREATEGAREELVESVESGIYNERTLYTADQFGRDELVDMADEGTIPEGMEFSHLNPASEYPEWMSNAEEGVLTTDADHFWGQHGGDYRNSPQEWNDPDWNVDSEAEAELGESNMSVYEADDVEAFENAGFTEGGETTLEGSELLEGAAEGSELLEGAAIAGEAAEGLELADLLPLLLLL